MWIFKDFFKINDRTCHNDLIPLCSEIWIETVISNGETMKTMGKIFTEARESKGWTLHQLARKCSYGNLEKWAGRIRSLESGDVPFPDLGLLRRITKALEIEHSLITRAIFRNFLELNQPIKPYLIEKIMPTVYIPHPFPDGLEDIEEIKEFARDYSREKHRTICIALSQIRGYYIFESGKEEETYFLPYSTVGKALRLAGFFSDIQKNLPLELLQRPSLSELDLHGLAAIEKSLFG